MIKRVLFTLVFLVIWLPCLLFTSTNASFSPPLPEQSEMAGPFEWKYTGRSFSTDTFPPKMLLQGHMDMPGNAEEFTIDADFIEWLYSGGNARHKVKKGPVFVTHLPYRPHVTQWDIDHDKSMRFTLGALRFNWKYLTGLFLSVLLLPLFILWMLADDISIVTPQERKRRDDAFLELVKLIEARAKTDPAWLGRKTIRFALLGYAVILGSIFLMIPVGLGLGAAVLVLTGGNAAAAKLAFVLAAVPIGFAFVMGKSLLLPRYEVPGVAVTAADAPKLFGYLSQIIKDANGPRFEQVYISNDINASVSRHTGFLGFFGFGPVTLALGLPLMQSLTLPQLGGVIGHEYGHVAAKDNALGQWVYRIRTSWLVLGDRFQLEKLWYALKLNRFYSWFIGVFSAYSFALSRQCEYEADAFAAKLAGAENAAAALCAVAVRSDETGTQYWRDQWKRAETTPNIEFEAPYSRLAEFFAAERNQKELIDRVQKEKTGYSSTHPATMDRVGALGQGFITPVPVKTSAAAELLGELEARLAQQFNAEWRAAAKQHWEAAHKDFLHHSTRYAELKQKPLAELARTELMEFVAAADRFKDDPAIIAASEEILRLEPGSTIPRLNIAGLKLTAGDESQLPVLEALMKEDAQVFPTACGHAIGYFHKTGRPDEAKPWEEKLNTWEYERQAASEERELVLTGDEYAPHGLPPEKIKALAGYCAQHKVLHTVYLAQKKVRYMPEYPAYLLAFKLKSQVFRSQKKIQDDVTAFIAASGLGGEYLFIEAAGVIGLEGKLKKTEGARIYSVKDKQ